MDASTLRTQPPGLPPLASGVLAGVTREAVVELCVKLGLAQGESDITPGELHGCEGVFVTLSSMGVVAAVALDGTPLRQSPLVERRRGAYEELLAAG